MEVCDKLMATSYLNLSICHYMIKNYDKSAKNAQLSLDYAKTIKAYFRLG
jgi:hypothetical protein